MVHRIAILGNSHTAALKSAWDSNASSFPGLKPVFFAARSSPETRMGNLKPIDGKLVPANQAMKERFIFTSGGLSEIDSADYDSFALVGLASSPIPLPPASLYSKDVRTAMYQANRKRGITRIVANIRKVAPDKPIFAVARPLPADPPDGAGPATDMFDQAIKAMKRKVFDPVGVIYLPQPADTVVGDGWTNTEYARGALRLRDKERLPEVQHQSDTDVRHMNAAYGLRVLEQLAAAIEASQGKRRR